jgi:PAS domain S-box-containing protein
MRQLQEALAVLTTRAAPENIIRRRAETVLAHLAHVPVAVLVANNLGRYVDVNASATRLTGYSRAELLRMSLGDLAPDRPRHSLTLRLWREFLARGRMSGAYRLRRKNGTVVTARYFAAANVLPGVHVSALALAGAAGPRTKRPLLKTPRRTRPRRPAGGGDTGTR